MDYAPPPVEREIEITPFQNIWKILLLVAVVSIGAVMVSLGVNHEISHLTQGDSREVEVQGANAPMVVNADGSPYTPPEPQMEEPAEPASEPVWANDGDMGDGGDIDVADGGEEGWGDGDIEPYESTAVRNGPPGRLE